MASDGQMSASRPDAQAYMDWMHSRHEFRDVHFKLHEHHEQAFPRCTVKYRKQLVAVDGVVDLDKRGEQLSPEKWQQMLEEKATASSLMLETIMNGKLDILKEQNSPLVKPSGILKNMPMS